MKTRILYLLVILTMFLSACSAGTATEDHTSPLADFPNLGTQTAGGQAQGQNVDQHLPPKEAFDACVGKAEQNACEFTAQKGLESGTCATVQNQPAGRMLACVAPHGNGQKGKNGGGGQPSNGTPVSADQATPAQTPGNSANETQVAGNQSSTAQPGSTQTGGNQNNKPANHNQPGGYNIEQATADKAQEMTISFDALAFMTGNLGADSFFPPGKVADFWGFQYLRDNDPSQMGHAGDFLTSAALNMLNTLTADERAQLITLAKDQVTPINDYAVKRFVLMEAFRRLQTGDLPSGTTSLNEDAVKAYSAELYHLDGQITFQRVQVMGKIISSFDANQKVSLDAMVGKGMTSWPKVDETSDLRGLDHDVKVAVMTYASDMFSWYAGSLDADVYFCPERHGTYFGSFYLKDAPAMNNPNYAIPTTLTGDMGATMLKTLTSDQAQQITNLVDIQKPALTGIVDVRRQIATELRKFMDSGTADSQGTRQATVLSLMDKYGQLDGEINYNMAVHFSQVSQSLTDAEKTQLMALRKQMLGDQLTPTGAYVYSNPIALPAPANTDFLFK